MSKTCGYTSGNINQIKTCGGNSVCSKYAAANGYNFGCCDPSNLGIHDGCYMSACYDYSRSGPATEAGVVILGGDSGGGGFYCPPDTPYCQNWVLIADSATFTSFGCASLKIPAATLLQRAQVPMVPTTNVPAPAPNTTPNTNSPTTNNPPPANNSPTTTNSPPTTTTQPAATSSTPTTTTTSSFPTSTTSSSTTTSGTAHIIVTTPPPSTALSFMTSTLTSTATSPAQASSSIPNSSSATLGIGIGVGIGATIAIVAAVIILLRYFRRKDQQKHTQILPCELPAAPPYTAVEMHTDYNESKAWHGSNSAYGYSRMQYSELSSAGRIHEMPGPTPELPGR